MIASEVDIREKGYEGIKDYADDRGCQEVLLFLGRHPRTRFSRLAIVHALNGYKWGTEQALSRLTEDGVIKRYAEGNVPLYSLSVEE
jgi:DNA-binding transcriptional ArsR family regulator